ncbi:MAG: sialidase family protein [Verrucomicrobiota bacterium]
MSSSSLSAKISAILFSAGLLGSANYLAAAPAPQVEILGQVVAVKDVCAWPKLTVTPKGELFAAIYNRPVHGVLPGDVDVYASTDGTTWTKRGTATQREGDMARFNHSIGSTRNGDLIVVSGGWTYHPRDPQGAYKKKKLLRPTASRSSDGGRTWSVSEKFPDGADGMTLVPFGNVETGADGALRVAAYSYNNTVKPRVDICYTAVSKDNGSTWTLGSVVGQPAANETDVVHLGGGKWLAAARDLGATGQRQHSTDIFASDDDAKTWRHLASPVGPSQHPADLLKLADGRVLLTVGDRRTDRGVNVHISADGGKTWTEGARISRGVSGDCGYPSTAQLPDGTLVTVFYAAKTTAYDKYQMASIRWRLK